MADYGEKGRKPLWEQQSSTAWNLCTSTKLGTLLAVSVHNDRVLLFFTFEEKSMEAFFSPNSILFLITFKAKPMESN